MARKCIFCERPIYEEYCQYCIKAFENRRPVEGMTTQEKLDCFDWWCTHNRTDIPFELIARRFDELLGRKVYPMPEMATSNLPLLRKEIETGKKLQFVDEIAAKFPPHVQVITHDLRDPSDEGFSEN